MEQVVRALEQVAVDGDLCVELAHHTRKAAGNELSADDARGASASVDAARSVRVLSRMSTSEAEDAGIDLEERRQYLRVRRDKANMMPAAKATWIRLVSVELPNGDGVDRGDRVQAVEAWTYPEATEGVSADDTAWVRHEVQLRTCRTSSKSPDWLGYALARRLGIEVGDADGPPSLAAKGGRRRVHAILGAWLEQGVLDRAKRRDGTRHEREVFTVGACGEKCA
jgi:hypothetical protein